MLVTHGQSGKERMMTESPTRQTPSGAVVVAPSGRLTVQRGPSPTRAAAILELTKLHRVPEPRESADSAFDTES